MYFIHVWDVVTDDETPGTIAKSSDIFWYQGSGIGRIINDTNPEYYHRLNNELQHVRYEWVQNPLGVGTHLDDLFEALRFLSDTTAIYEIWQNDTYKFAYIVRRKVVEPDQPELKPAADWNRCPITGIPHNFTQRFYVLHYNSTVRTTAHLCGDCHGLFKLGDH
jgi:hypothetical protein